MAQSGWKFLLPIALLLVVAGSTRAQVTTYYLHRENSAVVSSNMQLKTVGPDAAALTLQTVELRNQPAGEYVIKSFETQANVPNIAGVIPAGSSFLFRMYMDKTADAGQMQTLVKVYKNNTSGSLICNAFGPGITTSRSLHTFLFTTSADVTFTATDRFFMWVGVNLTTGPGSTRVKGELSIETGWDSRATLTLPTPQPSITNLSPATGSIGTPVTINGSNFGASQTLSTVALTELMQRRRVGPTPASSLQFPPALRPGPWW